MTNRRSVRRIVAAASCVAVTASGCAFEGLNSVPLPGAVHTASSASSRAVALQAMPAGM